MLSRIVRISAFVFAVVVMVVAIGCRRTRSRVKRIASPSGAFVLTTSVNQSKADPKRYLCVVVTICGKEGKEVHREVTPASDVMKWSIQWINDDTIRLDSSDVGSYIIEHKDGTWSGRLE